MNVLSALIACGIGGRGRLASASSSFALALINYILTTFLQQLLQLPSQHLNH